MKKEKNNQIINHLFPEYCSKSYFLFNDWRVVSPNYGEKLCCDMCITVPGNKRGSFIGPIGSTVSTLIEYKTNQ